MERAFAAHGCGRSTDLPSSRHAGFSLVELSIVLVILGLLTGGILTAQNLIRAAELRSVVTEFQAYQTAVMTFRDQYFALPGDMRNATDFWGASANCPGTATQGTAGVSTCNGNGNGTISDTSVDSTEERFRAWQHLARAGLIKGNYEGVAGSGGTAHHIPDFNSPNARISNAAWALMYRDSSGNGTFFDYDYGNTLQIGAISSSGTPYQPAFTPEEAWNIDTKMDDGIPGRGKVIAIYWDDLCSTAASGTTAGDNYDTKYRLADASTQCALTFRDAF